MIRCLTSFCVALMLITPSTMAGDAKLTVRFTVEEPSGVQRCDWPVTSGVPLAQGALKDPNAAALFTRRR